MSRNNFFFSYKKALKNTPYRFMVSSFTETTALINLPMLVKAYKYWELFFLYSYIKSKEKREVANCVLKDMLHLICMWRHIRGYPQGGNTTHTNSNTCKKNKLLFNFRVDQFYTMFGQKKRNIYPTLVKAEYNNRLWYYNWHNEWKQANLRAFVMAKYGTRLGAFNPVLLASNQTNNYKRTGKAAKISKAKKLVKLFTIGVPLLFTRYIFWNVLPLDFPKIVLQDEVNKKLGRKFHKREIKKKKSDVFNTKFFKIFNYNLWL